MMMNTFATVCTSAKIHFAKHFLLTLLAMFMLSYSYAQKTASSGAWNVAGTWTPSGVPSNNDDVTIPAGVTVTVPANADSRNLTINGTVTMANTGIKLTVGQTGSNVGLLTIGGTGTLTVGSANTLEFLASQGGPRITVASGGTFTATGTNGSDAGTVLVNSGSGADFEVTGNVSFYNVRNGSQGDGNWHLKINTANGVRINGTLRAEGGSSWGFSATTNAPIWGTASTFYADRANQGFTNQNTAWGLAWSVNTGTVGTTPGYPNNVTLVNMGSSQGGTGGVGWNPTGAVGLGGTLGVGDGTTNGRITLENATSVDLGGILVDNNSLFVSPKIAYTDRGNFTLQGTTTGIYQTLPGGVINFNGVGKTVASPQIISTTGSAAISFTSVMVSNGTHIQLQGPVNISTNLNFTTGYIRPSTTSPLTMSATATITNAGSNAYIDGPLSWAIPSTNGTTYTFPVGDFNNNAYLPLALTSNSTSGSIVTATGFNQNAGGTSGVTGMVLSNTEYWSLTTSVPFTSGPLVNVTRPSAVAPTYNAMAVSTAKSGTYYPVGGQPNAGAPGTITGGGTGTTSPAFIVIVNAPLSVVKLSGTNYGCNGTLGSLKVGGSGGKAGYVFKIDGGSFQAAGVDEFFNLTAGDHTVTVKDANLTQASAILTVLGSVLINGDNKDVITCFPSTVTLTATNLQNAAPSFNWYPNATATGPSAHTGTTYTFTPPGAATGTTTTTYSVKSDLYTGNKLPDGSFESGNNNGNFTSPYTNYTGQPQYSPTPLTNGIYSINTLGKNQCYYFTDDPTAGNGNSLPPQDGAYYFVGDGATAASDVLTLTIPGLTAGLTYKFQYWYAEADRDGVQPVLETVIDGVTKGNVVVNNPSSWNQVVYTFVAGTSATIKIRNTLGHGNTDGNDFYIDNMQLLEPCTVISTIKIISDCALPVELMSFNATKQEQGALITWSTASELNSAYYIVEKSSNGTSFEPVGRVAAAGNSHTLLNYSFVDPLLFTGITYYRLAQYDIDGSVHYSDLRAVQKSGMGEILIVPNPSSGVFNVIFDRSEEFPSSISIVNVLGQIVYTQAESTGNVKNIDISFLSAGAYYVQISSDEGMVVKKVIKE